MSATKRTVTCQMLIRKSVSQVFEAFIDPAITSNFWFSKGSGKLETGKTVIWEWEMYKVKAEVLVDEIVPNKKILVQWGDPGTFTNKEKETTIDFEFKEMGPDATYVVITNYGFEEKPAEELLSEFVGLAGGFTTVLDGLKAWMEHGIQLNLIADKFPKGKE